MGMLAQVANQQGKHLARNLNRGTENPFRYLGNHVGETEDPFRYQFMGSMAQLGTWDAVVDMDGHTVSVGVRLWHLSRVTCHVSPVT